MQSALSAPHGITRAARGWRYPVAMIDPEQQEQFRRAARELGQEVARAMEQAGRMFRQAVQDLGMSGPPAGGPPPPAPPPRPGDPLAGDESAVELIRRLGELRDAGYLTDEEFQEKKRQLLEQIR